MSCHTARPPFRFPHRAWSWTVACLLMAAAGCARFSGPLNWTALAPPTGTASERVAWALPLEGGPIHAVYLAPRTRWGDARALSERLDIQWTPIAAPAEGGDPPDAATWPEGLQEVLDGTPEVVVLAAFPTERLPPEAIARILALVRSGTGLVL